MRAVLPREVHEDRARLGGLFAKLERQRYYTPDREAERRALLGAWWRHAAAPVGWLDAPDALRRGRELEERRQRLLGGTDDEVLYAARSVDAWTPAAVATGASVTLPHEVLDYRALWDGYVMGTARAAAELAKAPPAAPPGSNLTPELVAGELGGIAESITADWNAHAGAEDHELATQAGAFLEDFQRVVRRVAKAYQPQIRKLAPDTKLPAPPGWRLQVPVVSAVEDAKILGHGVLQILGIGAEGALEALDATGHFLARQVDKVTDHIPILAFLGIVLGGAVVVKAVGSR